MLVFLENSLVYRPMSAERNWQPPPSPDIVEVWLTGADDIKLHAWYLPGASERSILYFHGNAGNLSHRGNMLVRLNTMFDASVLIVDYPGYGKSEGRPSEAGCYAAAAAAFDWLVNEKGHDPKQMILFGKSLGAAVAIELATRKPHLAVVAIKPFTSAPDVGAHWYPFVPTHWLMRNRFDNVQRIQLIHSPVLIAHGDVDHVIPFVLGERLFASANQPKTFIRLDGNDHNDPLPDSFYPQLTQFVEGLVAEHQP